MLEPSTADTIYALSSGSLPSGVAVVRLSGAGVRGALETLTGRVSPSRVLSLASIRSRQGELIDRGLVAFFPGPNSFTGEDCLEFQVHGGNAVVARLLAALAELPGLRPASAGEFTRRAFVNGKMSLTDAEALGDLVLAETEAQRRLAIQGGDGSLASLYRRWREDIIRLRARIEAELDFSDADDVPDGIESSFWQGLTHLADEMEKHVDGYAVAELIRDGFKIVVAGAPNVGKSSLVNALARREASIVTADAGTTRDAIDVQFDIDGYRTVITDTAGFRMAASEAESIGMDRARARIREADLVLHLDDGTGADAEAELPPAHASLRIRSKGDLGTVHDRARYDLEVSSKTGAGMQALRERLRKEIAARTQAALNTVPFRQRHVDHVREAALGLRQVHKDQPLELVAESLRASTDSLARLTGEIDVEDILGAVFESFCIGK